jgi:hypothetical protein
MPSLPLAHLGTCCGTAAARFNQLRSNQTYESVRQQRTARIAVVREMIVESWPAVAKRLQRLENACNGCCPYEQVCSEIMHCTGLQPIDEPAVATLVRRCIVDATAKDPRTGGSDFVVDLPRLKRETVDFERRTRPPAWEQRFRADGCVEESIQKATTGVEKNARRYMRQYTGAPFAITADAGCVDELVTRHSKALQDRIRDTLMSRAKFIRFDDPHHVDHPDHKLLTLADYRLSTSASAKKGREPLRRKERHLADGGEWLLTTADCREALLSLRQCHLGERETFEMMVAMDPKMRGFFRVDDVMRRFSFELLKPKCARNTLGRENNDGLATVLEWHGADAPPCGMSAAATRELRMAQQRSNSARRHTIRHVVPNRLAHSAKRSVSSNAPATARRPGDATGYSVAGAVAATAAVQPLSASTAPLPTATSVSVPKPPQRARPATARPAPPTAQRELAAALGNLERGVAPQSAR